MPWCLTTRDAWSIYHSGNYVVLDFETTNLDYGSALTEDNRLLLSCWSIFRNGKLAEKKHIFGGVYDVQELVADLHASDFLVAQNSKFELQWLKRCGVELRDLIVFDTMLAEWVIAGNRKLPLNLDAMCARYGLPSKGDTVSKLIKLGVCFEDIPPEWGLDYCHQDVALTAALFEKQMEVLIDLELVPTVFSRCLVAPVLADIEFNGMRLDAKRVGLEYKTVKDRIAEIEEELAEMLDGVSMTSSKQLGEFLYDKLGFAEALDYKKKPIRTPGGKRSTSTEAISKLKPKTEKQKLFLTRYKEYNRLVSLMTKNLDFFRGVVRERDGVFRASLNHGRAANHRLASSGIPILFDGAKKPKGAPFQNMPREYKRLFRAVRDGNLLGEVDGAQLEFRVAVELGKDRTGYKAITDSRDVHTDTMRELNAAGMNIDRQQAKPESFKPLYGGQSGTKAQQSYYKFFKETYHQIAETQRNWALNVVAHKQLKTLTGMRFYWPSCTIDRSGYIKYTPEIYNLPISYLATGEIIPLALVHFWHRTRDTDIIVLNTIHDSIIADFPPEEEERFREIALASLTVDVYNALLNIFGYSFRTPLGVGIKCSQYWGEGKEAKYNVYPSGKTTEG